MNEYANIAVNAIFTGLGSGIGIYLANEYIIKHTKKAKKHANKIISKLEGEKE